MKLTVLICTHNRAELLERVLASLNAARRPENWEVEVLVAANACSDDTHRLLESYCQRQNLDGLLPLKWFVEPIPGKSHALNSAIPRLDGELVTFVDDDHRVDTNFLSGICSAALAYPDATMLCGRIIPDWDGSEPDWVHDEGPYKIYPLPVPRQDLGPLPRAVTVENGPLPGGGNLALRTDVFQRVGKFSTELGPKGHDLGGGEDSEFVLKALLKGEQLQYTPDVLQYHYVDLDRLRLPYLLRKAYQRTRSISRVHHSTTSVPLYIWRKLASYALYALLPFGWSHTRFYFMRLAATLGEMRGLNDAAQEHSFPSHPIRVHRRWAAAFATFLAIGGVGLVQAVPAELLWPALAATLIVAIVLTAVLALKSLLNFSQTGPQIRREILKHYRWYSLFAFSKLTGYAFAILFLLTMSGVLLYGAGAWIFAWPATPFAFALAGLFAVLLITGLQFCRHLLYIPASIVASYHYRISRLYPLWNWLSPTRLKLMTGLLAISPALLALPLYERVASTASSAGMIATVAFSAAAATLYLWLLPRRAPRVNRGSHRLNRRPNVLMIGSDTLRADRVNGEFTPTLAGLCRRGVQFSQCYVPCARTAPSLISLLTGTWPHRHGVRDNFVANSETTLRVESLPRILSQEGYRTAALSDWCGADLGKFSFGFDYLDLPEDQWNLKLFIRQGPKDLRLFLSLFTHNAFGKTFLPEIHYLGGVPLNDELGNETRHLVSRLAAADQPFLLNVFFSTTHPPFGTEYPYYTRYSTAEYAGESKFAMARLTDPWEIIRRQAEPREAFDLDQITHLYAGCVRRFDDEVGRILKHLDDCGLTQDTIVVIYSDHGMEFFEHDTWGQGNSAIGDHSARVPLILVDPSQTGGLEVKEVVRSIDLAPTLLDLLGIQAPETMDGVSLAAYLRDHSAQLHLDAYNETGIWLTELPGMPAEHLHYPDLTELLEVPNKATGTLSIKDEYQDQVIAAKDRMIRSGDWKLVYQPLNKGAMWRLFNIASDPECREDVLQHHPEIADRLRSSLQNWINRDQVAASSATTRRVSLA